MTAIKSTIRESIQRTIDRGATRISMYSRATSNQLLTWTPDEDGDWSEDDIDCMVDGTAEDTDDYVLKAEINGRTELV